MFKGKCQYVKETQPRFATWEVQSSAISKYPYVITRKQGQLRNVAQSQPRHCNPTKLRPSSCPALFMTSTTSQTIQSSRQKILAQEKPITTTVATSSSTPNSPQLSNVDCTTTTGHASDSPKTSKESLSPGADGLPQSNVDRENLAAEVSESALPAYSEISSMQVLQSTTLNTNLYRYRFAFSTRDHTKPSACWKQIQTCWLVHLGFFRPIY